MALFPLSLRILSMAGKFGLMFALAKCFPPDFVGNYGLFSTIVMFAIYIAGMEFYVYTNRLLFNSSADERCRLILCQIVIAVPVLALGSVVVYFVRDSSGMLVRSLMPFLLPICITEYLAQELYRMLVVFDRQRAAAVSLFLRSGLWCLLVGSVFVAGFATFEILFVAWLVSGALAIAWSVIALSGDIHWQRFSAVRPTGSMLKAGLLISSKFLLLSLSLRSVEYVDRFFINAYLGKAALGVYTYYWSVASVVQSLLTVAVINVWFPRIVNLRVESDSERRKFYHLLLRRMCIGGVTISVLAWVGGRVAVLYFDKAGYLGNDVAFITLIVASLVAALSQAPQLCLYARGNDSVIVAGGVAAAGVSIALNAALVPVLGLIGAALAYLGGALFMAVFYHAMVMRGTHGARV
jgi:O-antigen/teichoic acid export membrane protein